MSTKRLIVMSMRQQRPIQHLGGELNYSHQHDFCVLINHIHQRNAQVVSVLWS
mgnify:CR=1 FL=1